MKNTTTAVPPQTPGPETSYDWWTGGDVDLTKNTEERLAYYGSLEKQPKKRS